MRGDHVTTFRATSSEPIPVARFLRVRFEEAPRPAAFHLTHVGIMKRAPMRSLHCFHLSFPSHHFLAPKIFSCLFPCGKRVIVRPNHIGHAAALAIFLPCRDAIQVPSC